MQLDTRYLAEFGCGASDRRRILKATQAMEGIGS